MLQAVFRSVRNKAQMMLIDVNLAIFCPKLVQMYWFFDYCDDADAVQTDGRKSSQILCHSRQVHVKS